MSETPHQNCAPTPSMEFRPPRWHVGCTDAFQTSSAASMSRGHHTESELHGWDGNASNLSYPAQIRRDNVANQRAFYQGTCQWPHLQQTPGAAFVCIRSQRIVVSPQILSGSRSRRPPQIRLGVSRPAIRSQCASRAKRVRLWGLSPATAVTTSEALACTGSWASRLQDTV